MKKLLIFALFTLSACGNTDVSDPCSVRYSDAQPIQFWPIDCDTFNQKEVDGVFRKCFCQPFECDDPAVAQLTDNVDNEYLLQINDEEGNEITQLPFTKTAIDGSPEIPGVTSPIVLPSLSSGTNIPGSNTDWTTGSSPSVVLTNSVLPDTKFSDIIAWTYLFQAGYSYEFTLDIDYTFDATAINIRFVVLDVSNNILYQQASGSITSSPGNYTGPINFIAPTGAVKYGIFVSATGFDSQTSTITINELTATQTTPATPAVPTTQWRYDLNFTWESQGICNQKVQVIVIKDGTPDVNVLKSDCLHIKEHWDETVLINYYNQRNFAGLIDPTGTPSVDFNLRIPAVFAQERFPQESEVIDLSNSRSIQLFSQLKSQKLLETGPMPFYMHRKTTLALQHQFVTVDSLAVVKNDPYELQESNKRWPLRRALCWLTEKDSIVRNVL